MSKAFTRESDELPERSGRERQASGLPPGAKNYMTAEGARRLRDELDRLLLEERPRASRLSDKAAAARQLADIQQRIAEVQALLRSVVIAPPLTETPGEVCFGVLVTLRSRDGGELRVRIVGVDEAVPERGCVSWISPLARALLGAKRGQQIMIPAERGEQEVEVVGIEAPGN